MNSSPPRTNSAPSQMTSILASARLYSPSSPTPSPYHRSTKADRSHQPPSRAVTRSVLWIVVSAISFNSPNHFPRIVYSNVLKPVMLPPGLVRLATKPLPEWASSAQWPSRRPQVLSSLGCGSRHTMAGASAARAWSCRRAGSRSPSVARRRMQRASSAQEERLKGPNCGLISGTHRKQISPRYVNYFTQIVRL
jgi:hypothetical protein